MLLEHNGHQYTAQSLAVDVVHNQPLLVDLKLQPHLGDTLVDLEDIGGLSKLNLSYPAEELKSLNNPKLGISIGDGDELIFDLNKDTGLSEITLAYEEGDYALTLNLYDDNQLVGVIQQADTVINLQSGEASEVNLIPLQADVDFRFNMNDADNTGKFDFTVPQALVDRVSGVENLAMVLRLTSSTETQETLRFFHEENGRYISTDGTPSRFDTQGQERVSAYLAFYPKNQDNQYNDMPLASCTFFVDVGINQTLSCKLSVDATHRIHGHILASLMLNVQHSDMTMAKGAKVYIDGKLVGLTGSEYNTASLKTHLVPGEHQVKIEKDNSRVELTLSLSPLDVVNKLVYLKERSIGSGVFVDSGQALYHSSYFALGDINEDGYLDIVTEGPHRIYFNDGEGAFSDSGKTFGASSNSVALGDVNGDGHLDIVTGSSEANRIYLNDGEGTFSDSGQALGNNATRSVVLGDVDGDGHLDVVAGNYNEQANRIYLNDGKGIFTDSGQALGRRHTFSIVMGDMNGDGYLDIVTGNNGSKPDNRIYFNNGKGHFRDSGLALGNDQTRSLSLGDMNGDGYLDIVEGNHVGTKSRIYFNKGKGNFSKTGNLLTKNATKYAIPGDVDNDGDLDVFAGNHNGQANRIYLNNGSGYFSDSGQALGNSSCIYSEESFALSDLDNDGDLDLVISTDEYKNSGIKILFNN